MPRMRTRPPRPLPERLHPASRRLQGHHPHHLVLRPLRDYHAPRPQEQGGNLALLVLHAGHERQRARREARG